MLTDANHRNIRFRKTNNFLKILLVEALLSIVKPSWAHEETIYEGMYVWGPEVESFTLCNSDTSYWVSFGWGGIDMHEYYQKNKKEPYQSMYLKFRGHLLDEIVDGFAEQYDGLIRISEAKAFSFELPSTCK